MMRARTAGIRRIPAASPIAVALAIALAAGLATACNMPPDAGAARAGPEAGVLARREARTKGAMARPDSGSPDAAPVARWLLPNDLKEVSGLALTADARLLAHDDSRGRVVEIDYRRGTIVKQFVLAPAPGKVDFEGITVADSMVFMLASNGLLYEFAEGKAGSQVAYTVHDLGLVGACEFEGVAYDASIRSLLLACKVVLTPALRDSLVIYRWKLGPGLARAERLSRLSIAASAIGLKGGKIMNPSDITLDPHTGNYVLISAREGALVEITPAGAVVSAAALPGKHPQAEGVVITKDHLLIVSDEAAAGPAAITVYRRP